jgi:porphobilinogen deaminase
VRESDAAARTLTASLDHFATRLATTAERAAERHLASAAQLAAASAVVQHAFITLRVRVLARDGSGAVDVMASGTDPDRVALDAAERALEQCTVAR